MTLARWSILAGALSSLAACSDDGIGDTCRPTAPCGAGGCGFRAAESYVFEDPNDCSAGQVCLVYHLDNGTDGMFLADPKVTCTAPGVPEGCVTQQELESSVYCSCPCAREGSEDRSGLCTCGDGFQCASAGGGPEWYCVRREG